MPCGAFPDEVAVPFMRRVAAFDYARQLEIVPLHSPQQREQPAELVPPSVLPGDEAEHEAGRQRRPDQPAHGVLAVAEEIGQMRRGRLPLLARDGRGHDSRQMRRDG